MRVLKHISNSLAKMLENNDKGGVYIDLSRNTATLMIEEISRLEELEKNYILIDKNNLKNLNVFEQEVLKQLLEKLDWSDEK